MLTCAECKNQYPDNCVNIMFTFKGSMYCCAICALEIRNKIHGLNDKEFNGEMANKMLKRCKNYLKRKNK